MVAELLWTHATSKEPKGHPAPLLARCQHLWTFSKNTSAAESMLAHANKPDIICRLVTGAAGYDIPPDQERVDDKVWGERGPPPGARSHYPDRGDT
ncbi:MAG: hypothetical protein ACK4TL_17485 [Hyphomicrobiaceae bacterium]